MSPSRQGMKRVSDNDFCRRNRALGAPFRRRKRKLGGYLRSRAPILFPIGSWERSCRQLARDCHDLLVLAQKRNPVGGETVDLREHERSQHRRRGDAAGPPHLHPENSHWSRTLRNDVMAKTDHRIVFPKATAISYRRRSCGLAASMTRFAQDWTALSKKRPPPFPSCVPM
jgi:hypothetical protein